MKRVYSSQNSLIRLWGVTDLCMCGTIRPAGGTAGGHMKVTCVTLMQTCHTYMARQWFERLMLNCEVAGLSPTTAKLTIRANELVAALFFFFFLQR